MFSPFIFYLLSFIVIRDCAVPANIAAALVAPLCAAMKGFAAAVPAADVHVAAAAVACAVIHAVCAACAGGAAGVAGVRDADLAVAAASVPCRRQASCRRSCTAARPCCGRSRARWQTRGSPH